MEIWFSLWFCGWTRQDVAEGEGFSSTIPYVDNTSSVHLKFITRVISILMFDVAPCLHIYLVPRKSVRWGRALNLDPPRWGRKAAHAPNLHRKEERRGGPKGTHQLKVWQQTSTPFLLRIRVKIVHTDKCQKITTFWNSDKFAHQVPPYSLALNLWRCLLAQFIPKLLLFTMMTDWSHGDATSEKEVDTFLNYFDRLRLTTVVLNWNDTASWIHSF